MMFTDIWYVAEESDKLGEQLLRVRMLGRDFVLFRDADGRVACLSDVCPHRGSSLVVHFRVGELNLAVREAHPFARLAHDQCFA